MMAMFVKFKLMGTAPMSLLVTGDGDHRQVFLLIDELTDELYGEISP
ncbi:hypothetical protein [Burkholderia multivorans]|nr:hypothetical protein [Burkholderia multivorans]